MLVRRMRYRLASGDFQAGWFFDDGPVIFILRYSFSGTGFGGFGFKISADATHNFNPSQDSGARLAEPICFSLAGQVFDRLGPSSSRETIAAGGPFSWVATSRQHLVRPNLLQWNP